MDQFADLSQHRSFTRNSDVSVFEASKLFRQSELKRSRLQKNVQILRKKQLGFRRNNQIYQNQIRRIIDQTKPSTGNDSAVCIGGVKSQNVTPKHYFDKSRYTRETSQRLKEALLQIRKVEARSVRQYHRKNKQKLANMKSEEYRSKKKKRDKIMSFQKCLRQTYSQFKNRRLLKTSQQKRRALDFLWERKETNEKMIQTLERERQALRDCVNEGNALHHTLRVTLKKANLAKSYQNLDFIKKFQQRYA